MGGALGTLKSNKGRVGLENEFGFVEGEGRGDNDGGVEGVR